MPGPVPKRSEQRRRQSPADSDITQAEAWPMPDNLPVPEDYEVLPPDENWHPIAKRFYVDSLRSGQVYYYEASEYALLYMLCESISRDMKPQVVGMDPETGELKRARIPLKGTSLNAYGKIMAELLITEGSRRRAKIELTRMELEPDDSRKRNIQSLRDRLAG